MNLKVNPISNILDKIGCYFSRRSCLYFVFLISIVLIGCQKKSDDPSEIVFSRNDVKEFSITAKKKRATGNILQPMNILYKNGWIVLAEKDVDTLIHILDAESLAHITSKGVAGFGPNEIPSIWNLDSGPSDSTFWAYSITGKTFNEYSLYDNHPLSIQQIKQSEEFFLAMGITWASPKSLMTYLASGEDKYVEYDLKGNRISSYGRWKGMIQGGYSDHVIADVHQGKIRSNLANGKIVKASIFRDRIEILNKDNGEIIGIVGPINVIPKFDVVEQGAAISGDFTIAYTDLWLSDKYIFALYSGKSDLQVMKSGPGETDIFVFDYEGNALALLKADLLIKKLTSDKEGSRLFVITEEADPTVAVYDVPNLD